MFSIGWTLRSKQRMLEVSRGGRWYLAFTVALGVVAIYSGNNVIYLLVSLLLSSLLLSGILSELTLSRVSVTRIATNIHAGRPGEDVFVVENLGRLPLYCVELGEWRGEERELTAFLLMLPGRAKLKIRSRQLIQVRGRHRWDGLIVATSFPFGFARKSRFTFDPGSRIVWPKLTEPGKTSLHELTSQRGELDLVAGEVRPMEEGEDAKRVHWPVSLRVGQLMTRPLRWSEPRAEIRLELRPPSAEMELRISRAAGALSRQADTLAFVNKGESKRIQGSGRGLDALALLPKEEEAA